MVKTAFVTGGSHGIGKAVAIELAHAGYNVGISYRSNPEGAEETLGQIKAAGADGFAVCVDLSKLSEVNILFDTIRERFGAVDVFVNNAGQTKYAPFLDVSPEMFENLVGLDYRGAFFCAQAAAKDMIAAGKKGSIINISSVHRLQNYPTASVYGSVKAAVYKLTQHIALELAPYGIRCNSISPGYIKTGDPAVVSDRERMFISRIPAHRVGSTADIAKAIRYLVSDDASFVTGIDIPVDGGALLPAMQDNKYYV